MTAEAAPVMPLSPAARLAQAGLKVDGVPFSLRHYPFTIELLNGPRGCRVKQTTTTKGGQMGFTAANIVKCLDDAQSLKLRGIGYFFPTEGDATAFAKARFDTLLDNDLFRPMVGNVDSAGLKQIGETWFYFRGAGARGTSAKQNLGHVKSIPLDIVVLDESDEMSPARIDAIEQRMGGSLCPELRRLSTPTLPGFGVDWDYKQSDQRTWHRKCPSCNAWTCLEIHWPECLVEPREGEPYYACHKCHRPIERFGGKAEWVAAYPEKLGKLVDTSSGPTYDGHAGYWVSQLSSPTRSAAEVLLEQDKATKRGRMREFYNQVLARPYAELEDMLTKEIIDDCLTAEPMAKRDPGPCAMGVDPGKKRSWWWVKHRTSDTASRTLAFGFVNEFSELDKIARDFNVECGVMDGQAETHAVRQFVESHPGWWMNQYVQKRKGAYDWDARNRVVTSCRTEALDASHDKFVNKQEQLPAPGEFYGEEVVPQLVNMARKRVEDEQTGNVRMDWVIVGGQKNDHLKHAHGYATMAEERVGMARHIQDLRRRARQQKRAGKRRSFMAS